MFKTKFICLFIWVLFLSHFANFDATGNSTNGTEESEGIRQPDWQDITTVEDVWEVFPDKIHHIFASLDLQFPGLEPVLEALNSADTVEAGYALVSYFKNGETAGWLRNVSFDEFKDEERLLADQLLDNMVTRNEMSTEIPTTHTGGWDWTYSGPDNDAEFSYTLNRHRFFHDLLKGWHGTGNTAYVEKFDLIIRDWIIHNPLPDENHLMWEVHRTTTAELDWRDIGEVIWRDLDAGIRLGESWLHAFFGFQQAERFTPAVRLMMLYSITVHADYLQEYHKDFHNWTTMEMNGLGLAGISLPEFKKADEWADYALQVMENEINGQVYPDGVQLEISTNTQWVALHRFELLVENYRKAGRDVSEGYLDRIEIMYDYIAYSMRPDGHQPLNNDSDREDVRSRILRAAEIYKRPDWVYIATNGQRGTKPAGLPSRVFPWAGIHVMRNGWDEMSHWGFFHTGPYGIGHQHRDNLHLSVHAYGRDLLVDGGRYTHEDYFSFDPAVWRGYFRSSFSHNVILVDGAGQNAGPFYTETPLEEGVAYVNAAEFDYAVDTFSSGFENVEGEIEHTRAVFYVRGKFWVIVDHIATDRPRTLQALWHYAPDVNAVIVGDQVVSDDAGQGNLRIVPAGDIPWELEIIKGQTEPYIQGWYSETYGKKEPNPAAVYSANIDDHITFAWILVPANGRVPEVMAEIMNVDAVKVRVHVEEEEPVSITVPLRNGLPELNRKN